jgi:alpha-1,2-mannosyltransferase
VGVVIALLLALMTAIPNNHAMGQANFPGLLLALAGLWQAERGRPQVGGVLMGIACMLKMSPALFVLLWLVRREWVAAGMAVLTGALLSLLVLPIAGLGVQWRFYTQILPTFSSGWYNGLSVPIGLFGNHSIPSWINDVFPGGGHVLTPTAQALSTLLGLGTLTVTLWTFRGRAEPVRDPLVRAAQAACVGVVLLLLPVYTYEHHLVFALPAAVVAIVAALRGRLTEWAVVIAGLCVAVLLIDLQALRGWSEGLPDVLWAFGRVLRELKFLALIGLFAITLALGRPRADA